MSNVLDDCGIDTEIDQSPVEHYKKFLDLWKDADTGIAEVEDSEEEAGWDKG
jgi:hypothetical protein